MFGDILYKGCLKAGEEAVLILSEFKPLGETQGKAELSYSFDGKAYFPSPLPDQTFRYLKIKALEAGEVVIAEGHGFLASRLDELSANFDRRHLWSGADGIYSFNLARKEDYNQKDDPTLFVFGDTFVGESLPSKKRLEPTKMVNNSLCYFKNGEFEFYVRRDKQDAFVSCFALEESLTRNGYLADNLTLSLGKDVPLKPYISALSPKEATLTFALHGKKRLKKVEIKNFYDPSYGLEDSYERGASFVSVETSLDGVNYVFAFESPLLPNRNGLESNAFALEKEARYVRFHLPKLGGLTPTDQVAGLNKVTFYDEEGPLSDVTVTTDSLSAYDNVKSWFWLQDGYVKGDTFYVYPEIVEEELNGIEGFEFRIAGVTEVKVKIKDERLDLNDISMRKVPFYSLDNDVEFILGNAILDNTSKDGYLYIYGYKNDRKAMLRSLVVSRIKEESLGDYNELRYFDGKNWTRDFHKAKLLVPHVSTEMSVIPLISGYFKGKYLAIFQYDSIGRYVTYAIMDTPYSFLGPVCPLYETPELGEYTKTTYTYNAKAHLHLSTPEEILVSYNVNDMSMKANKEDASIYHPRFLKLKSND